MVKFLCAPNTFQNKDQINSVDIRLGTRQIQELDSSMTCVYG